MTFTSLVALFRIPEDQPISLFFAKCYPDAEKTGHLWTSLLRMQPSNVVARELHMNDVTQVLQAIGGGDKTASEELLPLVYNELRNLAAEKMAREAEGHTLQATALVHEAYIKLVDQSHQQNWNSRNHFFMAAAESMRRILIDRARAKSRQKRGGGWQRLDLEGLSLAMDAQPEVLLLLHDVMERFEKNDEVKAQVVKLKFYAGLTNEEVAQTLNVSTPTVKRYWNYSRAWLMREIERVREEEGEGSTPPEH